MLSFCSICSVRTLLPLFCYVLNRTHHAELGVESPRMNTLKAFFYSLGSRFVFSTLCMLLDILRIFKRVREHPNREERKQKAFCISKTTMLSPIDTRKLMHSIHKIALHTKTDIHIVCRHSNRLNTEKASQSAKDAKVSLSFLPNAIRNCSSLVRSRTSK